MRSAEALVREFSVTGVQRHADGASALLLESAPGAALAPGAGARGGPFGAQGAIFRMVFQPGANFLPISAILDLKNSRERDEIVT